MAHILVRILIFMPDKISNCLFLILGEGQIVGGNRTKRHELPFMALLGYRRARGKINYECGGALINR